MNKYKFNLLERNIQNNGETETIYRYNSIKYKDLFMWRDSKNEAYRDFDRWLMYKQDTAKGMEELSELRAIEKVNSNILLTLSI